MTPFLSTANQAQTTSIDSATLEASLVKTLEHEHRILDQLTGLLQQEHQAILDRDTETLGSIMDKKLPLLSQLEQFDQQRQSIYQSLTQQVYTNELFSQFISTQPSETLQSLWQAIKIKLPECKTQNEVNGRMISIRQQNTEQILQILTGRPANKTQTYSHLGKTSQQRKAALYTQV
jgi:flagella synthesis protein FlgN